MKEMNKINKSSNKDNSEKRQKKRKDIKIKILKYCSILFIALSMTAFPKQANAETQLETQLETQTETQIETKTETKTDEDYLSKINDNLKAVVILQIVSLGAFIGYVGMDRLR